MSIISESYYTKDINLETGQITTVLRDWQDIYEEKILKSLLGYTLYELYVSDLNTTGAVYEPVAQRFKDLVDGKEFSFDVNGYTINTKFEGLRNKTTKRSLVAYYTYYMYRNEVESFNTSAGQMVGKVENSEKVSVHPKLVHTWNKLINWYGYINWDLVYSNLWLDNGNYSHLNALPSAYNFLLANLETYPEWVFEPLEDLNIWGI